MRTLLTFTALASFSLAGISDASAQRYIPNLEGRLESLELHVKDLKASSARTNRSGLSGLQVDVSRIEEEIRKLRGATEENRHAIDLLKREMQVSAEDIEYRLNALEGGSGGGAISAVPDEALEDVPEPAIKPASKPEAVQPKLFETPPPPPVAIPQPPVKKPAFIEPDPSVMQPNAPAAPIAKPSKPTKDDLSFTNPRDHYNYAVSLVKERRYDRARSSLQSFISRHGDDRLIGNAHYWLGETYYVRDNFPAAADEFRQGFEAQPSGIKAPDNLYKLSKSLLHMNKDKEACIVLAQIQKRYADRNPEVAGLAFETEKSAQCQ